MHAMSGRLMDRRSGRSEPRMDSGDVFGCPGSACAYLLFRPSRFYVMGAAVLHQQQLVPQKSELIEVLSSMFGEPFGPLAKIAFLVGAGIVLFKTLYLACAANSRLTVDFLNLNGIIRANTAAYGSDGSLDSVWFSRCWP